MPMPVITLVGSASYAMKRPRTKLALKTSLLLMTMLFLLMVLMAQSGSFALPVRSHTTLDVSLVTQNNKSMPKDGHLPAHSMSVKVKQTKWVTLLTNNPGYPRSINRVTNGVSKRVTIFDLYYCRKMAKMKFSRKEREARHCRPQLRNKRQCHIKEKRTRPGKSSKWTGLRHCGWKMRRKAPKTSSL